MEPRTDKSLSTSQPVTVAKQALFLATFSLSLSVWAFRRNGTPVS
jgi:hypothetical protein